MNSTSGRLLWLQHQLEQMSEALTLTGRPEGKWLGVLAKHARLTHAEVANMEVIERGLPPPRINNVRAVLRVVQQEFA
jgi:hypothetical protein